MFYNVFVLMSCTGRTRGARNRCSTVPRGSDVAGGVDYTAVD